jgi:hypothetical protein
LSFGASTATKSSTVQNPLVYRRWVLISFWILDSCWFYFTIVIQDRHTLLISDADQSVTFAFDTALGLGHNSGPP